MSKLSKKIIAVGCAAAMAAAMTKAASDRHYVFDTFANTGTGISPAFVERIQRRRKKRRK